MAAIRRIFANVGASFGAFALASTLPFNACSQSVNATDNHAAVQLEQKPDHIHGGSDLALKIKLNQPLPLGARFDVRLSPVSVNQQLSVSSGEPLNRERTEFIVRTKMPEDAYPGPWHIGMVWLFLPGATWTTSQIAVNDVNFTVEGRQVEIPTTGTATLVSTR